MRHLMNNMHHLLIISICSLYTSLNYPMDNGASRDRLIMLEPQILRPAMSSPFATSVKGSQKSTPNLRNLIRDILQLGQPNLLSSEAQQSLPSVIGVKRPRNDDDDDQSLPVAQPYPSIATAQNKGARASDRHYKCTNPGCGYATTRLSDLKKHVRKHTGERPYRCIYQDCTYASIQSSDLRRHERTHTGDRPHSCTYQNCPYVSTQLSDLRRHLLTHADKSPYSCIHPGCTFTTIWTNSLAKHCRLCRFKTNNNQLSNEIG